MTTDAKTPWDPKCNFKVFKYGQVSSSTSLRVLQGFLVGRQSAMHHMTSPSVLQAWQNAMHYVASHSVLYRTQRAPQHHTASPTDVYDRWSATVSHKSFSSVE